MSHRDVVTPLCVNWAVRTPLATALMPSGTVMWYVNVALSEGWSLLGSQVETAFGSAPMNCPSGVCRKPYGEPNTIGEPTIVSGTPP